MNKTEEIHSTRSLSMNKLIAAIAITVLVAGCGKSVDVDGTGMYLNGSTGMIAIGDIEVVTNPSGADAARLLYEEDVAWLSNSTKTHKFKAQLCGTNACCAAERMVEVICHSFAPTNTFSIKQ